MILFTEQNVCANSTDETIHQTIGCLKFLLVLSYPAKVTENDIDRN